MHLLRKLASIVVTALLLHACGGGGVASTGSGGSGIGGTGMTLVQGNVLSVDGQLYVYMEQHGEGRLLDWLLHPAYAQVADIVVSGGGQSATVNSGGSFAQAGVTPSSDFILRFTVNGRDRAQVNIGKVNQGSVVTVRDISIDTRTSSAKPKEVEQQEYEEESEVESPHQEDEAREEDTTDQEDDKDEMDEVDEVDEEDEKDAEDDAHEEDEKDEVDEVDEEDEKDEK